MKYKFGSYSFNSKAAAIEKCKQILGNSPKYQPKYKNGDPLFKDDYCFVSSILKHHPKWDLSQATVIDIVVERHGDFSSLGFTAVIDGGTKIPFSYKECLGQGMTHKSRVIKAFRAAIWQYIMTAKHSMLQGKLEYYSEPDGRILSYHEIVLDHYPVPFCNILQGFLSSKRLDYSDVETIKDGTLDVLSDNRLIIEWRNYHDQKAQFRIISAELNSRLGAH